MTMKNSKNWVKRVFEMKEQRVFRKLLMLVMIFLFITFAAKANYTHPENPDSSSLEGRWDITIDMAGKEAPSWLEVRHAGLHTLVGDFVGTGGSARPVSKINFNGGKMILG